MPVDMQALCDDLEAETADLRGLLVGLDGAGWRRPTPAQGWSIVDQISHLAHFDEAATRSAAQPDAFHAELERLDAAGGIDPDAVAAAHRHLSGIAVLGWFDRARGELLGTFRFLPPDLRVPWYGHTMSAASSATARLMETWAHGQDIADALGVRRLPTHRLRHVAHIGVGARPYSYRVNGLEPPAVPVRVELTAPDGELWTWGPAGCDDRVRGSALDFCLVVTQRRHRADTALRVDGPAAAEWMSIAQAFAGVAGTGRAPGRFTDGAP